MKKRALSIPTGFGSDGAKSLRADVLSCPVTHVYVPDRDAWCATGFGTAGIAREQPDGRLVHSFFIISLLEGGIVMMFGKDSTAKEHDEFVNRMRDVFPPFEDGTIELLSEYVWGAYALSEEHGASWDAEAEQYLSLVPRPPGNRRRWIDRLIGPGGLTPQDLVKVIRENPLPEDLPEGKEIMILTEMSFHIEDERDVVAELRKRDPEFEYCGREKGGEYFSWTREYPPDHWSPLASLGGRQILGDVRVVPGRLIAEAKTLSMACRLIYLLKNILAGKLTLEKTTWRGMQDILQTKKQRDSV
ncbi:MAG: hypothetical protein QMC89_05240 [Candidatus Hodarchaeaceae archaeon]|nr:hypothetical protein [Candidatus Hodarchaeaceae archaeon]